MALAFLLLLPSCADNVREQDFFRFRLCDVHPACPVVELETNVSETRAFSGPDCIVRDSIMIALTRTEHLFAVSDLSTGNPVGLFCRKGRSWNEPLSALPLSETYVKSGDLVADVFSFMDSKLFVWNISQSMKTKTDVYENVIRLGDGRNAPVPWMSFYRLDDHSVIAYNSMQAAMSQYAENAPVYEIYDTSSGEKARELKLFNAVNAETDSPMFTSKIFLSNVDCIKPDRSKLCFCMSYMPVYCILDIESGEAVGYRIKGLDAFAPREQRWHFADVQTDGKYIYALYSGEILFNEQGTDIPNILYVMDWDGNLKLKCRLGQRFTGLDVDNGCLYMGNPSGLTATVETERIADLV